MTSRDEFKAMANAPEPLDDRAPWERCGCAACQSTKALLEGPACPVCEDGGTVVQPVGPLDAFGVPNGTVEVPCPACAAGDAEAVYRAGLSVSSSAARGGPLPLGAARSMPGDAGVSGSLVRGGDPDPSLNPRKAAR